MIRWQARELYPATKDVPPRVVLLLASDKTGAEWQARKLFRGREVFVESVVEAEVRRVEQGVAARFVQPKLPRDTKNHRAFEPRTTCADCPRDLPDNVGGRVRCVSCAANVLATRSSRRRAQP